ncbi:PepSY domain-containing protein [Streptomyces sp. NBC_00243]|uniref:PepSY domain-containing protein n=1 Tax=Streptomyces sp. NBC_00243 TaxID=2975688 RepID=UPI002DDA8B32|nr:PepSY domain-containing protein [Streptomyces sp. NBC_00243]WRZ19714.1 PepSY domain-containing protein [Streptomyces sp. NBC_00243]
MKRNIVIATVAAAALVGGGTATALAVTGDDGAPSQLSEVRAASDGRADDVREDEDGRDDDATVAKSTKVTAADALAGALRHTPGTAVSAELDDDDDAVTWDIDILDSASKWHSVHVDPATGKVLSSHTEREDDSDDADDAARVRAALQGGSISATEAAKAAAAHGTVTSIDLDEDSGSPAWEAETRTQSGGTEHDWLVDLRTAQVTPDRSSDDD